jgi:hypothetical protein
MSSEKKSPPCACCKDDLLEKSYRVSMQGGGYQCQLMLPAGYLQTVKGQAFTHERVQLALAYPSMNPLSLTSLTEEKILFTVDLIGNAMKQSLSSMAMDNVRQLMKNPAQTLHARHIGTLGIYDVYETVDPDSNLVLSTYFTRDKNRNLVCFQDGISKTSATRRYARVFELTYVFSPRLRARQLAIDAELTTLLDSWVQKVSPAANPLR